MKDASEAFGRGGPGGPRTGGRAESAAWFGLSFAAAWALLAAFAIAVKHPPADSGTGAEVVPAEATAGHEALPATGLGGTDEGPGPRPRDAG